MLRQCVWFNLSIHFVSRDHELHHQLRRDSLTFCHDDEGLEYVVLRHENQQKNLQGGINSEETRIDSVKLIRYQF
jgi:hypothetical protein